MVMRVTFHGIIMAMRGTFNGIIEGHARYITRNNTGPCVSKTMPLLSMKTVKHGDRKPRVPNKITHFHYVAVSLKVLTMQLLLQASTYFRKGARLFCIGKFQISLLIIS